MKNSIWAPKGLPNGLGICKIPYNGYEISIAMDDSCGCLQENSRSHIKVFRDYDSMDVTRFFCGTDEVHGATATVLKILFSQIDMFGDRD